jgi:hypothetical protein
MAAPAPSSSSTPGPRPHRSRFGDTTLTKVFVGGLAWETPSVGLRQHFERYGDILEAVVIADRVTGRSKGYGFVSSVSLSRQLVNDPASGAAVSASSLLNCLAVWMYAGDVPGGGGGAARGAGPEPDDRRAARQLQHCLDGADARRAASR